MATVRARLPADAIFTNGAGNFSVWAHRFYEFRDYPTQLAPTSGAMGYGVPAAVAAKLLHPERDVVAIAGDGDFLMTGQELATAVQYDAPIVVLIVNNGMFGTIRMHQERHYPGRVSGTDLVNPDFAALARGVRRARGGGRAHRGLRRCLRRGARRGTARRDRAARRPRGADAAAIADRDSRAGDRPALDARRITHRLQTPTREGAPPMAKSYASTVIKASPDEVWAHVRDFNGLATWHSGLVSQSEIEDGKAGDQVGGDPQLHAHGRDPHPGAAARALRPRALLHLRLPEDAVRRRQLLRHAPGHPAHGRRRQLRRVVDDVRLRPRPAGALDGLLRHEVFQGGFDALKAHFA